MIFIDSNILIDLIAPQGAWREWSETVLIERDERRVINRVVVAEIARQFDTLRDEESFLGLLEIEVLPMSDEAAFRAGKAHSAYRRAGGQRTGILADFLIGAHAQMLEATLVTRDRQRFATYFPELTLITPETDNG